MNADVSLAEWLPCDLILLYKLIPLVIVVIKVTFFRSYKTIAKMSLNKTEPPEDKATYKFVTLGCNIKICILTINRSTIHVDCIVEQI